MRLLLAGATGQLGREICRARLPVGTRLIAASRNQLDLARPTEIRRFVDEIAPDAVINAAAFTGIERAEIEPDLAFAVNRDGAAALARAAAAHCAPIIHISTGEVFDGSKPGEWTEDDQPNPLNVHGESKLIGEFAVAGANPRHLILRTSWLYAAQGQNFPRTMLRLGRERTRLNVVDDQFGRPTSAADLADALLRLLAASMRTERHWGTYHFSNSGDPVNWHGFARSIFSHAADWYGQPPALDPVAATAIGALEQFPFKWTPVERKKLRPNKRLEPRSDSIGSEKALAARPGNSVLSLAKIERVFGLKPRPWPEALAEVLREMRLDPVQSDAQ